MEECGDGVLQVVDQIERGEHRVNQRKVQQSHHDAVEKTDREEQTARLPKLVRLFSWGRGLLVEIGEFRLTNHDAHEPNTPNIESPIRVELVKNLQVVFMV